MTRRALVDPLDVRLAIDPHPTGRARYRALLRWRIGREMDDAGHLVRATAGDREVTPADVDWDLMPASAWQGSGTPGRQRSEAARTARPTAGLSLPAEVWVALDALAMGWGCSRSEAVARLVRERGGG